MFWVDGIKLLKKSKLIQHCNYSSLLKQILDCVSLCFRTDVVKVNEPANAAEDAAAVSAISKQQILVQYLKVSFNLSCFLPVLTILLVTISERIVIIKTV